MTATLQVCKAAEKAIEDANFTVETSEQQTPE